MRSNCLNDVYMVSEQSLSVTLLGRTQTGVKEIEGVSITNLVPIPVSFKLTTTQHPPLVSFPLYLSLSLPYSVTLLSY